MHLLPTSAFLRVIHLDMSGVIAVGHNGMNAFPFLFKPSLKAVHEQQEDETTDLKNFGHFHRDESPRLGPSDIRHYELHKGSVFTEHRYVYRVGFVSHPPTSHLIHPLLSFLGPICLSHQINCQQFQYLLHVLQIPNGQHRKVTRTLT